MASLIVTPGTELDFLHALPVGHLWGVGPVTLAQLSDLGISSIGELAEAPTSLLADACRTAPGSSPARPRLES